ncbi:LytR/AlgR family response regulator transcription factor [Tenacibaculum sp. MEBiC06402]|uniref:LytR/AlgR family response regulator transcription factor n=1 Tax=unclassified Tenacibaculum TaxID=2635139 RepID=UPI003B9CCBAB
MVISVLIVDDEPHARRYLRDLLKKDDQVGLIHECKNGKEVVEVLKHTEPDIIFLDINMPAMNGIEVAAKLNDISSLIIFSTAYDQYALKAFELKAFDYLLKPYDENRFNDVLSSAKHTIEIGKQADFAKKFSSLYNEYNQTLTPHLTEFEVKEKGYVKKVKTQEIVYIEASSVYVILHVNNSKILYRVSLNLLEQQLPPNFIRVHRSFIINKDYVKDCKYLNNNTFMLKLSSGDVLISSRKYKHEIAEKIANPDL